MKPLPPLNVFEAPLSGLNLIEASAGTGKTYTITGLYLRLVLEFEARADRILVVTYTKAATGELKERIRQRLVLAREAFIQGDSDDKFCQQLLSCYPDREQAVRRLTNAVRGFDEAAIFTIHGFCQRVLRDRAFESGMAFDAELIADQRALLQEIVDDFWRREFYGASSLLVNYLLERQYSPETLLRDVQAHLGKPYLKVLGPERPTQKIAAELAFNQAYHRVRSQWSEARSAVAELLYRNTELNANRYRKASINGWLSLMDDYLLPELANLQWFDAFSKFTTQSLIEATKKGQSTPRHPFFDACQSLALAYQELSGYYVWCLQDLQIRLLDYCNQELALRKQERQMQSYDDLLVNLQQALASEQGEALAEGIRRRYSAALIDEFQDTDPIQYDIFRQVYADSGQPVFLVGDPKQAIYSFRGADIFAYLKGRADAANRYTLDENWRSHPDLIRALNVLFQHSPRPFLFPEIPFQKAVAAERSRQPLNFKGEQEPEFHFWFLGWDENDKAVTKGSALEQAARATAAEIARLLNESAKGQARIADRALEGGDIAVLVRSHRQGRLVRNELLRLGVPSVQQAQDNVFASWEAQELERVLLAMAEPSHENRVRAALVTDMQGMFGEDLYRLQEDEQAWEATLEVFHAYHRLWREYGFIRMFRTWLSEEDVPRRLLRYRDGERRLTNLLHLAELLQHTASRERTGMEGLIKWLSEQRQSEASEDEEHQLRLESDEHLVKIVTVHKSKGLEYPVVFCPFLWDGRLWAEKAPAFAFHDPQDQHRPTLDMGSAEQDENRQQARREELAENLRLLYVAVTRARCRCYLVWGTIRQAGTSALAWLLHGEESDDLDQLAQRVDSLSDEQMLQSLAHTVEQAEGAFRIESLLDEGEPYSPAEQQAPELRARHFNGPVEGRWWVSSFSALTSGHEAELPDYDAAASQEVEIAEEVRDIFSFPRGARAGSCLHLLFERWDFTCKERQTLELLTEKTLEEHGFEIEWTAVVADMVERVLATPLGGPEGPRLQQVTQQQRLNELEFYYSVADLSGKGLRSLLEDYGYGQGPFAQVLEDLTFVPIRGYMKGFIDLVFESDGRFYLLDYKSNWLGATPDAYHQEAMNAAMARDAYYFQYLIYSVALHRYLRRRLPDYAYEHHFGGVFYLFLRGMDPSLNPALGVYSDRPTVGLIQALDIAIAGERS